MSKILSQNVQICCLGVRHMGSAGSQGWARDRGPSLGSLTVSSFSYLNWFHWEPKKNSEHKKTAEQKSYWKVWVWCESYAMTFAVTRPKHNRLASALHPHHHQNRKWGNIFQLYIYNLVESMPRHIEDVLVSQSITNTLLVGLSFDLSLVCI